MKDRDYITLVSGFGRCGSSLTMQMLDAAGLPGTGPYPSFEAPEISPPLDNRWLVQQVGRAVKILDPHRPEVSGRIPRNQKYRSIFLTRNPIEQGKSQAKLAHLMLGFPYDFNTVMRFAMSYGKDKPKALRALNSLGPVLEIEFEQLLQITEGAAALIALFLDIPVPREGDMVRQVRRRSPACTPGLDMEVSPIADRKRAATP